MRCDHARERIGALVDGELAAAEARALHLHLDDCPACMRYRDELRQLQTRLPSVRMPAPRGLAERVRAGLTVEASAPTGVAASAPRWRTVVAAVTHHGLLVWRQAAAVLVACALSAAITWWWVHGLETRDALARDVLSAHLRSVLQDNAVQIASVDTHTVKPWFAGRLDYTPVVKDLSAEGFRLIGGRLDVVDGRRVAAIVYRRRLHQVSVFIWPGDAVTPAFARLNGYNLVSWHRAGMTFWAASDLNEGELRELQSLL